MKNDNVSISLKDDIMEHSRMPDWNKFWAIPTTSPHLREFISSVVWDCVGKSLVVEISETPSFSAFNWFNDFPEGRHEEGIAICFLDEEDREIARLLFTGLSLSGHRCVLSREDIDKSNELIHEITLKYKKVSKIEYPSYVLDENNLPRYQSGKLTDEEWVGSTDPEILLSENA